LIVVVRGFIRIAWLNIVRNSPIILGPRAAGIGRRIELLLFDGQAMEAFAPGPAADCFINALSGAFDKS
jgi:hypothetical protein